MSSVLAVQSAFECLQVHKELKNHLSIVQRELVINEALGVHFLYNIELGFAEYNFVSLLWVQVKTEDFFHLVFRVFL